MIHVDTDNALGSVRGDVDDGFALAALLRSPVGVIAVASVFGNTTEASAHANNQTLGRLCGFTGTYLRGAPAPARDSEAAQFLVAHGDRLRVAALGPLTNIAAALERGAVMREVVVVGGNLASRGRWPPIYPFEFNLVKDRRATQIVLGSAPELIPELTIVPLDVARRMTVTRGDLAAITGALGGHLRSSSERWFRRARLTRWSRSIPLWDLVAAAYFIAPDLLEIQETAARVHSNAWLELGAGGRSVRVVRALDREAIWRRVVGLLNLELSHDAKLESADPGVPADRLRGARAAAGERAGRR